ncbi:MAG: hypothetical protein WD184_00880 [Acidimicrobiia bacterium]
MKFGKFWYLALGIWLILFGVFTMGWLELDSSGDIIGILAVVTGVLVLIDK